MAISWQELTQNINQLEDLINSRSKDQFKK